MVYLWPPQYPQDQDPWPIVGLYLAISVNYTNNNYKISKKLTDYVIKKLMNENQEKINKVIDNLGTEKYLLLHLKRKINPITFKDEENIFKEIQDNPKIIERIKENIYIKNILKDFEDIEKLDVNSKEYLDLKNKIINVGEYKFEK